MSPARSAIAAATLAVSVMSCGRAPAGDTAAQLAFVRDGKPVKSLSVGELTKRIPPETFSAHDPYYDRRKTYRALPLRAVLREGFGVDPATLSSSEFVLKARDGYTVPLTAERVLEEGAYLAFADAEVPGWEPIGPQRANPGPLYLVWRGEQQQRLETHPRPWQLAEIGIARFEDVFPHTVPTGEAAGSTAWKGFEVFRGECIRCHAINREGGRIGPELNVPQSIVEYRPEAQIRAYIRNPQTFRYSAMPAHPQLTDDGLDALVAYFTAMKSRKVDPGK